jgi:hypothetical protein
MTIGELIKKLQPYDPSIPVKVFCAFDSEGPNTWETPRVELAYIGQGTQELHITP